MRVRRTLSERADIKCYFKQSIDWQKSLVIIFKTATRQPLKYGGGLPMLTEAQ